LLPESGTPRELRGRKLVSFDKCGHVPAVEKTEEFLAAVTSFLGGAAAAAHLNAVSALAISARAWTAACFDWRGR